MSNLSHITVVIEPGIFAMGGKETNFLLAIEFMKLLRFAFYKNGFESIGIAFGRTCSVIGCKNSVIGEELQNLTNEAFMHFKWAKHDVDVACQTMKQAGVVYER